MNSKKKDKRTAEGQLAAELESCRRRVQELEKSLMELKENRQSPGESEEQFRLIAEQSMMAVGIIQDGVLKYFNKTYEEMSGYSADEIKSWQPFDFSKMIHPDDRDFVADQVRKKQTGHPDIVPHYFFRAVHKSGGIRWLELHSKTVMYKNRPADMVTIIDNTERRKAEERLRESEEQYRLLVENANDAIFVAQDGVIIFSNSKTEDILGYTAEELARIPFKQHIHPEDWNTVVERHKMRLQKESPYSVYSIRVLNRSGEEFWFEINADWEGRPATLNFMRDITEQKRLEAQLLHAQKMEAVGTLAGGLAHDFNNLLTGILGNATLVLAGMDPSDRHYRRLRNIETIVKSAAGLTRQLLAFSRRGRMDVKASDINEILDKTAVIFSRTRKEISVHQNLDKKLWPVEVDRGQMAQVLLNLFVNAWQAMPGGGHLYLETANAVLTDMDVKHPYMKPGRYVKISVTDTGTGMDEKTKVRIFEPFFTTKEMGRGTGLGLAMVYGIIKGHNGYINVYSEPGRGTTFSVYLPASEKEISREVPLSQDILSGTETILVVDDEEMNIDVSREILNLLGYTVLTASNGQDALALYAGKRGEIDLILLDMIMPGMSGGETYDRMKEINPDVRVILCSGYSINGDARKIMKRGCNGFIQKPFSLTDLSQKIRRVLDSAA